LDAVAIKADKENIFVYFTTNTIFGQTERIFYFFVISSHDVVKRQLIMWEARK